MNGAAARRLLLVLPIIPWPIRRDGISLRFAPIIDYLARRYQLDLLILAAADERPERNGPLRLCRTVTVIRVPVVSLPRFARKVRAAWSGVVPWGLPFGAAPHLARRKLELEITRYLQGAKYAAVIWAAGHLNTACAIRVKYPEVRFIMDLVDSPALGIHRARITRPDLRVFTPYTAWKWRRLERKVQDVFDAVIYVAKVDAYTARQNPPAQVRVVPNGIMVGDAPTRFPKGPRLNPVIGFLGNMSYEPNVSAVLRLAERIFPLILANNVDARLVVIGRNPVPAIRNLQNASISVTGTVDDIWSYISQISVFVFPMVEGTGLQNKILEAMYAEVPVVTTPPAAAGVGGLNGEHLLVGVTDDEIVDQTLRLLRDPPYAGQLARRAKQFVVAQFDWDAILPQYEAAVMPRA